MSYESILESNEKSKFLAKIVAHLMGDGCVTDRYLRYNNKDIVLLRNFKNYFQKVFGRTHFIEGHVNSGTNFIQVQNKESIHFLKNLIKDYRSSSLYLPKFVNNIELKKEFLKAFYDDEGCVNLRIFKKTNEIKRNLTLSSNSLDLIHEIKQILQNDFNIKSNKIYKYTKMRETKTYTNYVLSITGRDNFIKFRDKINFNHPDKNKRLDKMISSYLRIAKLKNGNK